MLFKDLNLYINDLIQKFGKALSSDMNKRWFTQTIAVVEKISKTLPIGLGRITHTGGKFLGFFTTLRGVYNFVGAPPTASLRPRSAYRA